MKKNILLVLSIGMCFAFASCAELFKPVQSGNGSSTEMESTSDGLENSSDNETQYVTVTFKQEGKTDVVKTLGKGDNLTDIPIPAEKTGYNVIWDRTDFTGIMEDIVVNAVATANTYTVTYDANGGLVANATQEVTYDAETILATPEKEDYLFLGWYYEGTAVVNGKWVIADDVTLVAQWEDQRPTYKVTFVQGELSNEVFVKKGEAVATADIPTFVEKTGYSVVWDKTDYTNIQADMTVTARYTANTYTVTYDADGFEIDGMTATITYDEACTALDMTLSKEGYRFLGWKYNDVTYTNASIWNVADNVTLMADWAAKEQVVVTFTDTNGSTISKTVYKGETLTDIPTPKAKTGYTVDTENWYIDAGCSIVATFTNLQENITVYAKASANKYTVTYNANGGLVVNATQEVVFDADYTLETPTHTESYMRFDGWKDAENNTIALTGKWTTDRDMSLTAQWTDTREIYTISFVQAGQETKTFSVKEGESFTEIPTPTAKIGYTVVWNKNEFTNVTENITVMAIETAKTYTIILNANGGNVSQTTFTVTYGQAYEFEKPIHKENAFSSWKYNGEKVALSGVWDIDIESGEGELLAEWGDSIWSKNY